MPYNNLVSRTKTQPLVPEEVSNAMVNRVARQTSAAMQLFRNIPITTAQARFPILSALPLAYFVAGDTGLKQTTEEQWSNRYINVEELAAIVPIPEAVINDIRDGGGVDIWAEVQPDVEEAIGRTLDAAVFFGTGAPATWPTNVSAAALAAGNTYVEAAAQAAGGIQDDIDATLGLVEVDGFEPSGIVGALSLRGRLRRQRTTLGERLSGTNGAITEYDGLPIVYPMRGMFPTGGAGASVRALIGDFSDFVIGIRQQIQMKVLDQAVITDNTGAIIYNLPQQDMIAVRFTLRVGWAVSNRINFDNPTEATRYPAARLMF